MQILDAIVGFNWDDANLTNNWLKHGVTPNEAEQVLFNQPLLLLPDVAHSTAGETRWYALGKTLDDRLLFVAFTLRANKIRVISCRNISRKERKIYGQA